MQIMPYALSQETQKLRANPQRRQTLFKGDIPEANPKINLEVVTFSGPPSTKTLAQAFYKRMMGNEHLQKVVANANSNIRILANTVNPETGMFKLDIIKIGVEGFQSLFVSPTRSDLKRTAKEVALAIKKLSV